MQNVVAAPPAGHSKSAKAALAKPIYIYIYKSVTGYIVYIFLQVIFIFG